ncbi:unnamed protein product [Spodoptera exigua]|nr:unnamed protein product [Spodoptera exigua]
MMIQLAKPKICEYFLNNKQKNLLFIMDIINSTFYETVSDILN